MDDEVVPLQREQRVWVAAPGNAAEDLRHRQEGIEWHAVRADEDLGAGFAGSRGFLVDPDSGPPGAR